MGKLADFSKSAEALSSRFPGQVIQAADKSSEPDDQIALHLYHAPNSICSQKVRAVLAATGQAYVSHPLNILSGESYDPTYVRVRAEACESAGLPLARIHGGSTSVASKGCDACVVPTVLDMRFEDVLIDSRFICLELDRRNSSRPSALVPAQHRERIAAELAIVDELPNYQLLADRIAKATAGAPNNVFSASKVQRCEKLMAEFADDELLWKAYDAKRSKEQEAADRLFDPAAMSGALAVMTEAFSQLSARLLADGSSLMFGDQLTMADLFWGLELIRAEDLGLAGIWSDGALPRLETYYLQLCALPALQQAVLDWPGARFRKS